MQRNKLWFVALVTLFAVSARAQNTFPGPLSVGSGGSAWTIGTGDVSTGAWLRNDGLNPVISTNVGDMYFGFSGNSKNLRFMGGGTNTQMILTSTGNVGIGTTSSPSYRLDVGGAIHSSNGFVFPDGTTQTTAYANNGVLTASDPTYGSINLKMNGANIPVVTFTRWAGTGSVQNNAYAGLFYNASDGYYDYGIGTGVSTTGDQTATVNRITVTQDGTVGIGTTAPGERLEVNGNVKLSGGGAHITFPDGTTQNTAWNGTLGGGDYAESVDITGVRSQYEPGDVLVVDADHPGHFLKATDKYSTLVAGIYSTKPGIIGRRQATDPKLASTEIPMAMVGIVPTKVSAENGSIHPGDIIVTSSTPGRAMKGTDRSLFAGAIVGKALGSLDSGDGVIEVLVSLQ